MYGRWRNVYYDIPSILVPSDVADYADIAMPRTVYNWIRPVVVTSIVTTVPHDALEFSLQQWSHDTTPLVSATMAADEDGG